MRKLKTLLVLLFAVCLSLTLFACGGDEEEETSSSTLNTLIAGEPTISLTDADDQTSFNQKLESYTITGRNGEGRITIKGSECDVIGTIDFGTVGHYDITLKPRENNENGYSVGTTVVIDHAFGSADAQGIELCSYCHATRIQKDEDVAIHYGTFHSGTGINNSAAVNAAALTAEDASALGLNAENANGAVFNNDAGITDAGASERIKEFGRDASADKNVPSLTAGDLAPGMTISIEGYIKTDTYLSGDATTLSPWEKSNEFWNIASFGIADPYSTKGSAFGGYKGGDSVIVRSEGWVLYDGIGDTNATNVLGGLPARVGSAAKKNGAKASESNYGSHTDATPNDEWVWPDGYNSASRPGYTDSAWKDWWVYSEGRTRQSGNDYSNKSYTHVRVTWTYRTYKLNPGDPNSAEVGIIEIANYHLDENTVLYSYIKVPEATRGSYRTIIHGDYSTMLITKSAYVQTETVTDMRINGFQEGAVKEYLAGEQIDAGAVFNMEVKSVQNTNWHKSGTALANTMLYYTTQDTAPALDATEGWTPVENEQGVNTPLNPNMKHFMVVLESGGNPYRYLIPEADDGEVKSAKITIYANNVAGAVGDGYEANLNSQDPMAAYTRKLGKDNNTPYADLIIERAIFRAIGTTEKGFFNFESASTDDYRFTTIRIRGIAANGFDSITQQQMTHGQNGNETYYYTYKKDGNDVLLALAIKESLLGKDLIIGDVQTASATNAGLRVRFGTSSLGFGTVTSTITYSNPTLAAGGEVTVNYQNLATGNFLRVNMGESQIGQVGVSAIKNAAKEADRKTLIDAKEVGEGITVTAYEEVADSTTTKITFSFPAFNAVSWTTMPYISAVDSMLGAVTYTADYVEYSFADIAANNKNAESGVYFTESNGILYLVTAKAADRAGAAVAPAGMDNLGISINNGTAASAKYFNLAYEYAANAFAFKDGSLGSAFALRSAVISKAYGDYGVLVIVSIDVKAATGIEGDYGFQIEAARTQSHYWKCDTTKHEISQKAISGSPQLGVVTEGDCFTKGTVAKKIVEEGKVVFLADYAEVGGQHVWGADNTCDLCGATKEAKTLSDNEYDLPYTLQEGHFVEITGTYNATAHKEAFNGIETNIRQSDGTAFYVRVRNDGYYERSLETQDAQATLLYNSTPSNTANGVPNGIDGEPINTATDYLEAKQEGTFRVVVYFVGGDTRVVTVVTSLWTKDQTLDQTPYFTYTVQIGIGGMASAVAVNFRLDVNGAAVGATGVNRITGTISPNTLQSYDSTTAINAANGQGTAQNFSLTDVTTEEEGAYVGAYEEGKLPTYAERIVPSGKAGTLTADQKTALGVTGEDIKYFYSFTANWTKPDGAEVRIIDLSTGEVYEYGYVNIEESGKIKVVIPYSEANTLFMLDFANTNMNTTQGDVVIDLGNLRLTDITMSAGTTDILGGDVILTVSGGSVPADAKLWLGEASLDWGSLAQGQTLGDLTVKTATATSVTLTVPAADLTKQVNGYTIALRTAGGGMIAEVEIDPINIPGEAAEGDVIVGDYYIVAEGNSLTFVKKTVGMGDTAELTLNVNKGDADVPFNNYNVSAKVNNAGEAVFVNSNVLTAKGKVVWSRFGNSTMLAITFDLSAVEIDGAYGFQIGADETNIYTVGTDRKIATVAKSSLSGTSQQVTTASCTEVGLKAKTYSNGGITFFYDIVVTTSHTWSSEPSNGLYYCTVCGAIRKYGASADGEGTYIAPALFQNKDLLTTGLTYTFWMDAVGTSDWNKVAMATGLGDIRIQMPNIDLAWKDTDTALTPVEKELWDALGTANAFPSQNQTGGSGVWDSFTQYHGFVAIVIEPNVGVKWYMNDVLMIEYSDTIAGQPAEKFVELFLRLVQRTGLIIGSSWSNNVPSTGEWTVKDSIVLPQVTDDSGVAKLYSNYVAENSKYTNDTYTDPRTQNSHTIGDRTANSRTATHTYGTVGENTDALCTVCGAINPNHTHVYENKKCKYCGDMQEHEHTYDATTHKCTQCQEFAPIENDIHEYTNGVCSCGVVCTHPDQEDTCEYCGAVYGSNDSTLAKADFKHWVDPYETNRYTVEKGKSVKLTATYSDGGVGTWNGLMTHIFGFDGKDLCFRPAGDCAQTNAAGGWNYGTHGGTLTPGFMGNPTDENPEDDAAANAYITLKKTAKFECLVEYTDDGKLTVTVTVFGSDDAQTTDDQVLKLELTGGTADSYEIGFVLDGAEITEAGATITTFGWYWAD